MDEGPIRVAIVDEDSVTRRGLELLFAEDDRFEPAASCSQPAQMHPTEEHVVTVIDPANSGRFQESWLPEVRARLPKAAILVYTRDFDGVSLGQAQQADVNAYLLKGRTPSECLKEAAVLAVRHGVVIVDEAIRAFFRDEPGRLRLDPGPAALPRPLSPREREVLGLSAQGLFDEEIGERLGTSPNTVHNQVRSAMEKLGARTREQAVLLAVRYGLIDPYAGINIH